MLRRQAATASSAAAGPGVVAGDPPPLPSSAPTTAFQDPLQIGEILPYGGLDPRRRHGSKESQRARGLDVDLVGQPGRLLSGWLEHVVALGWKGPIRP
jgi:hypothetical protein